MMLVYAALALAAVSAAIVTALTTCFALKASHGRSKPAFLDRPCQKRRIVCLISAVLTGLASQCVMLLSYPLGPLIGRSPVGKGHQGQPVVVCLHGLYHNAAAFMLLRPVLARYGFNHVLLLTYASLGRDFSEITVGLLERLRREIAAESPLLFWGHSLGGLLVRRLMAEPDIAQRTLAAVTLGAPHRGSTLARLALGRLGRSLVPQSPLFPTLEKLPDPPGAALLSLASPMDNMVTPSFGLAIGRPGWVEEATAPVSHVAMLYHPGILKRSVSFLRHAAKRVCSQI